MPFSGPADALRNAVFTSSADVFLFSSATRSTTDTLAVGTRIAMPSSLPFSSGSTSPTAEAAPVVVGMIDSAAARARRRSLCGRSSSCWSLVYEWTVVIQPLVIPNDSCSTLATGARQFVVHEAFEMIWCLAASYLSLLTPSTTVMSGFFVGAVITTFFAPAVMCLAALSRSVKMPVDSNTTSTPSAFHGSCAGSFIDRTWNSSPPTVIRSPVAEMSAFRLPRIESYLRRCASVFASVRSLTATMSIPLSPMAARMMLRPMRPNPLIPTFTAIANSSAAAFAHRIRPAAPPKQLIVVNGLRHGQTADYSNGLRPMYAAYTVFIVALVVVMSPVLLYQAIRYRKYIANFKQRMGYLPVSFNLDGDSSIWIHAVSVGEVLTARALLPELRERYPRLKIFLSTTTMTGQQIARNSLQFVDGVFYFPFDLGFIVNRTVKLVNPRLFIMMETEIWPNLLRACHRAGVKTMLVNGRISSRSYPRYRIARPFFRHVLRHVDRFCMQSEESARRVI